MKRLSKFDCILILILILAIVGMVVYRSQHPLSKSNGVLWKGTQDVFFDTEQEYIAIVGFDKLYFKANQYNQQVNFYNPNLNNCIMNMRLELADGLLLWDEPDIYPDYGFYDIDIYETLPVGVYDAVLIVDCYSMDGNQLNGGTVSFKLIVN